MAQQKLRLSKLKFYEQPAGSGACGKYAIQNALVFLGIAVTQDVLDRITQTSRGWTAKYGIDENQIRQAITALKFQAMTYSFRDADIAKKKIDSIIRRDPIILSTESGEHWVTLGRKSGAYYIVIDSARKPLIRRYTWRQLCEQIDYDGKYFYFIRIKR